MSGRATKFLSYFCVLQVVFLICRSTGPSNYCSILCFVVSSYSRITIFGALGQTPAAWGVSATLGLWHCSTKLRNWMKLLGIQGALTYLSPKILDNWNYLGDPGDPGTLQWHLSDPCTALGLHPLIHSLWIFMAHYIILYIYKYQHTGTAGKHCSRKEYPMIKRYPMYLYHFSLKTSSRKCSCSMLQWQLSEPSTPSSGSVKIMPHWPHCQYPSIVAIAPGEWRMALDQLPASASLTS